MKLYIAGPMTGIPDYNFPAFDAAAHRLRCLGHEPISPADLDRERGWVVERAGHVQVTAAFSLEKALAMDFASIIDSDGIVLLPGWETSRGAQKERRVAEDLGRKIFHLIEGELVEEKVWIIGLTGYARTGKDTVGAILGGLGFERLSFADNVRRGLLALDPQVWTADYGVSNLSYLIDRRGWHDAKDVPEVRRLLQRYGTEAGREIFGKTCWIDLAMKEATPFRAWVFTDVRYPNEAAAIREKGGEVWRIHRDGYAPVNSHASDNALDEIEPDRIVMNHGTLEDLEAHVRLLVEDFDRLHK